MDDIMQVRRQAGIDLGLERESVLSYFSVDFRQKKRPGDDGDESWPWVNSLLCSLETLTAESPEYAPDDIFLQAEEAVTIDFYSAFHKSPSAEFKWQRPIRARKPSGGCLKSRSRVTTPTSPKKQVKFADDVGLSLEMPLKYVASDDHRAFQTFSLPEEKNCYVPPPLKYALYPCFDQPGSAVDFLDKTLAHKVCLENAMVCDELAIHGTIRVADIGDNKNVKVRFTTNNWQRYYDLPARKPKEQCDGPTARFTFRLVAPGKLSVGDRVEFAVVFEVEGQVYWDNNNQENYVFECQVHVDSGRFQICTP